MAKLSVIIGSTRPGRVGLPVGQWFFERATAHGNFQVDLVDLKQLNLPFLDESKHPRLGQYENEHTIAWSAIVKASDAFVFVTPEYNFSAPPTLLNAFNFLFREWAYKPAGFVSYGGMSGGIRAVQMLKQPLLAMKAVGIPESVAIPFVAKAIEDGKFRPSEAVEQAAVSMLDELRRWSDALAVLRAT